MYRKLIITDYTAVAVHVFSIEYEKYTDGTDFDINLALDDINEEYDLYLSESSIDWMLGYDDTEIIIH